MKRITFSAIFKQKMDYRIPTRKPDVVLINKKFRNLYRLDFPAIAHHKAKRTESESIDNCLDSIRELKIAVKHEGNSDTIRD